MAGATTTTLLYFYQMVIAAGGTSAGQVFIQGKPTTSLPTPADDLVGVIILLDEEPFVEPPDETVKSFQGSNKLLCDSGSWSYRLDSLIYATMFVDSVSKDIEKVTLLTCEYTYKHADYDHLTIESFGTFATVKPVVEITKVPVRGAPAGIDFSTMYWKSRGSLNAKTRSTTGRRYQRTRPSPNALVDECDNVIPDDGGVDGCYAEADGVAEADDEHSDGDLKQECVIGADINDISGPVEDALGMQSGELSVILGGKDAIHVAEGIDPAVMASSDVDGRKASGRQSECCRSKSVSSLVVLAGTLRT